MNNMQPKNENGMPENSMAFHSADNADDNDIFSERYIDEIYYFEDSDAKGHNSYSGSEAGTRRAAQDNSPLINTAGTAPRENPQPAAQNNTAATAPAQPQQGYDGYSRRGYNQSAAQNNPAPAASAPAQPQQGYDGYSRRGYNQPAAQNNPAPAASAPAQPQQGYNGYSRRGYNQPAAQDNTAASSTPAQQGYDRYPQRGYDQPAAQNNTAAPDNNAAASAPVPVPAPEPAQQSPDQPAVTENGKTAAGGENARPIEPNYSETALMEYVQPALPGAAGAASQTAGKDSPLPADKKRKKDKKNGRAAGKEEKGIYRKKVFIRTERKPAVFPRREAVVRKPDSNITLIMLAAIAIASVLSLFSMRSYIHTDIQTQSMSWMNIYNNSIHNLTSEILSDAVYIKKEYVIPENALAGAEPDPEGYHVNIENSIEQARDDALVYGLMQSPEMVFSEELELWNGQPAEYYLDETIFSVVWKEALYGCTVNFAEIFIADPSQIRRKLSQNQYGSPVHMLTSALADSTNAVTAMSGDFYGYRTMGCTVYQRKVYRSVVPKLDICFIDSHGDFILKHYGNKEKISEKEMQKYVDDNDIIFSLSFGPNLIVDGKPVPLDRSYSLGQPDGHYARAAIAQMGTLHYLLCTIDGGVYDEVGTDVAHLAQIMIDKNCLNAYTMDGGQTATIYFNKKVFNRVGYGSERNISDIVYFASAKGGSASVSVDEA